MQKLYSVVLGTSNGVPTILALTIRRPVGSCPDITLNCADVKLVGSEKSMIDPSCIVPKLYPES
jgi:hypothetical protein